MNDEDILKALEKKALGYEYQEIKVIASRDGKTQRIEKTTRHVPPDIRAVRLLMLLREQNKGKE